ncbi:hypothetical protein Nepgr_008307 [Nepenthes gracilis]|uniref:Vacuolar amino acid transporter YPQ1 n=1 Tax=Nepenthes gracilis TaxID=150966 RepID=A0AAD3S996_NEPGR|nr:hypothetical protein Nepgr_008307 [Nepenthes gracilis]
MKHLLKRSVNAASYCWKERKPCVRWVDKYFKDCLCNQRDDFSFAFGIVSLVAWGVAEVPQIITNFRTKSGHGVSLLFLLTWVLGDMFNLLGCLLEPATLPTQFYTALLYTVSTVVLVLQSIYYDHFNRWWKCPTRHSRIAKEAEEERKPLMAKAEELGIPIPSAPPRSPAQREFYYTSARSLAGSDTPPFRSYLRGASSGPSAVGLEESSSSDDERTSVSSSQPASGPNHIPRSAAQGAILAASVNLPMQTTALTQASLQLTGMRLVQQKNQFEHHAFGQWLGWLMAAIYMGGRIPQIILNIKRGSVEGLNPLMFIFALIANITYVASILVRSTKWDKIKENMPWLLDAVVCVALDLFIILQYAYYKYTRKK